MAILFAEPGGSPQQGLGLFSATSGTASTDTAASPAPPAGSNSYSCKLDSGAGAATAYVQRSTVYNGGGRLNVNVMWEQQSGNDQTISLRVMDSAGTPVGCFGITLDTGSKLRLNNGASPPVDFATGATTISTGVWYRITLAWTWTSQTVNAIKVWINGVQEFSVTNQTLGSTVAPTIFRLGWNSIAPSASRVVRVAHIYCDDSTGLTDPGDVRCTAKQYVGTGEATATNAFDTAIGTANATIGSRFSAVSERPSADGNGWQHAATAQKVETFTLQAASAGDADVSAATLIGWMAWVRTKTAASANLTNTDNDVDVTTVANTTTITNFIHLTTNATYPAGRFGVKSTGSATDSFFYEGGAVMAYTPATGGTVAHLLSALGAGG